VTVCGKDYTILYMNDSAAELNAKEGGRALIGKNLMDCHPPEAQEKLKAVMASGKPNVYTVEKKGVKKLIYQGHWKKNGRVAGLVEFSIILPADMPHFVRE
jgi:hypothetical protein